MMTAWFCVPPGWPYSILFIHLSPSYHDFVENRTFSKSNLQNLNTDIRMHRMKDEKIRRKLQIERKGREAVVVCGLAD